tara:strand:+ start:130 stop:1128 length:999 start_codon:yes stop_codon:yes gene_type:complete
MKQEHALSDDEILELGMHYGNPHDEFALMPVSEVPEHIQWEDLVTKYKSRDPVKCMRPKCGVLHNEGAVVQISTPGRGIRGQIAIGHCCGEKLFPNEYRVGGSKFSADLRRITLIKRKRAILSQEDRIQAWFGKYHDAFKSADAIHREFEALMPELFDALAHAVKDTNGQLRSLASSRSRFAEALNADGVKSRNTGMWEVVHLLRGQKFFLRGSLVSKADWASTKLSRCVEALRPADLPVSVMEDNLEAIRTIGTTMDGLLERYNAVFAALSLDNLRGIVNWTKSKFPMQQYAIRDGGIFREADSGLPESLIKIPDKMASIEIVKFPTANAA